MREVQVLLAERRAKVDRQVQVGSQLREETWAEMQGRTYPWAVAELARVAHQEEA